MSINQPIYKGDDTGAFGNQFITITINNPDLYSMSKIEVVTNGGCIPTKTFIDESGNNFQTQNIVLTINYLSDETAKFNATNTVKVVPFDMQGLHKTCPQTLVFNAQNGVINGKSCC